VRRHHGAEEGLEGALKALFFKEIVEPGGILPGVPQGLGAEAAQQGLAPREDPHGDGAVSYIHAEKHRENCSIGPKRCQTYRSEARVLYFRGTSPIKYEIP
jgi:hypothetical protein